MLLSDFVYPMLLSLMLGMARIYPCFILIPVFSFHIVKGMLRPAIVISMAIFVVPTLWHDVANTGCNSFEFLALIFKEIIIGVIIGLLLAMPFWLFESSGGLFDNQRGALMGGQLNSALGQEDFTPLGYAFKQLTILILIICFGMKLILQVLLDSYEIWPALEWSPFPNETHFQVYLTLLDKTFQHFVLYIAPLVLILMLMDLVIGFISIFSPQLQATILTIPVKCLVGLLVLVIYLPALTYLMEQEIYKIKDLINYISDVYEG